MSDRNEESISEGSGEVGDFDEWSTVNGASEVWPKKEVVELWEITFELVVGVDIEWVVSKCTLLKDRIEVGEIVVTEPVEVFLTMG